MPQQIVTNKPITTGNQMQIVSKAARREIVDALKTRYDQASKFEKGRLLAEFTAVSGYHRKHAIRLLSSVRRTEAKPVNASTMKRFELL